MSKKPIRKEVIEIKTKAKELGLTMKRLCEIAEVDESTFIKWQAGISNPNTATLDKFKSAFKDLGEKAA